MCSTSRKGQINILISQGYASLVLQLAFMLAFDSGVGALGWFMASEMVPVSARAAVQVRSIAVISSDENAS